MQGARWRGVGCRVQGGGVLGAGRRGEMQDAGCRVYGIASRIQGLRLRVKD